LKPGMSVLEVQPGAGWWTEILAPYARRCLQEFRERVEARRHPGGGAASREPG
jgi:hypothetical protein